MSTQPESELTAKAREAIAALSADDRKHIRFGNFADEATAVRLERAGLIEITVDSAGFRGWHRTRLGVECRRLLSEVPRG